MRTRRPTATWRTANGVLLKIVALPSGPDLLSWWWPLHRASRWAWYARIHWPINLEDFQVVGLVPRSGRPDLWVYRHSGTWLELFVDDEGATYRLRPLRTQPSAGRFTTCDIRTAIYQCGLHFLPPVEPCDWDREVGRHDVVTPFPRRVAVSPAPDGVFGTIELDPATDGPSGTGSLLAPTIDAGAGDPSTGARLPSPPPDAERAGPRVGLRAVPDLPTDVGVAVEAEDPGAGQAPAASSTAGVPETPSPSSSPPSSSLGPSPLDDPPTGPRFGPHGEVGCPACDDGTCLDCRELAHRYNGWCEDPTCLRCNDGEPWWHDLVGRPHDDDATRSLFDPPLTDGDTDLPPSPAPRDRGQPRWRPRSQR